MQLKTLILLLSAVSLFACSSTPEPMVQASPISSPQMNDIGVIRKGFSLSLPNQDEWTVVKDKPYKVVMTKPGLNNNERYMIQALVVKLPKFKDDDDFMKFISRRMEKTQKQSGVEVIEKNTQLVESQNTMCVQYNSKEQHSGKSEPVMLELVNFTCRHTENEGAGVYLAYSKKYSQGNDDKNFGINAADIFSYMELSAL